MHASLWHLTACLSLGNIEGREKRCDAAGRDINVLGAVNKDTITRGLRYSIATGNWGVQGTTGIRPGVSQVSALHMPLAFLQRVMSQASNVRHAAGLGVGCLLLTFAHS